MRTNLKIGLYLCLVLAAGTTMIGVAHGFQTEREEDLFFIVKIVAIVGAIIAGAVLVMIRTKSN
jgi:hypothetical protein